MVFIPILLAESFVLKRPRQPSFSNALKTTTTRYQQHTLISFSWRLCFTSGIILSKGAPYIITGLTVEL
jgi:hypothetical protein